MKLPFGKAPPPSTATFIVLACLALTCFVVYTEFQLQCFVTNCRANSTVPADFAESVTATVAQPEPEFRLLLGIITKADFYERRHLVRHAYALQPKVSTAQIDVRFVLCRLTTEEQKVMVAMEIMLYDDIIILNCTENMDEGKTYTYFSSLPQIYSDTPYDFVTKTDDDTYFRLEHLAGALKQLPTRDDVYLGFETPCGVPQAPFHFMSGMGYTLSWDVVQWIATNEEVRKHPAGPEDVLTSIWLTGGKRGKNRFDMNVRMYDFMEEPALCFRHPFIPDTIAVHKLKTNLKWARTLSYFNVTQGLKPSKRYHI